MDTHMHLIQFDGGSRGNPGQIGYGCVVYSPHERVKIAELGGYRPYGTNNDAEYRGLIMGLKWCLAHDIKQVLILGDSLLVVRQVQGQWKVNGMKRLYRRVTKLLKMFEHVEVAHVYRCNNTVADGLANEAMDVQGDFERTFTLPKEPEWNFMGHINFIV